MSIQRYDYWKTLGEIQKCVAGPKTPLTTYANTPEPLMMATSLDEEIGARRVVASGEGGLAANKTSSLR
jgi:hypothetical protein